MNPSRLLASVAFTPFLVLALLALPGCDSGERPADAAPPTVTWKGDPGAPRTFGPDLYDPASIPDLTTTGVILPTGGEILDVTLNPAPLGDPSWCGNLDPLGPWLDPAIHSLHGGRDFERAGQWGAAGGAYKLAVQQSPRLIPAWERFANALTRLGHYDEALTAFRNAVAVDPEYCLGQLNVGRFMERAGRPAEAEASFQRAIAAAPRYLPAHFEYARFLSSRGQDRRVLTVLERAARETGKLDDPDLLEARAVVHSRLGEREIADSLQTLARRVKEGDPR